MPYRRLPKTDKARIEALKRAVETRNGEMEEEPIPFALIQRAETILPQFINNVAQYNFFYNKRVEGNQNMKKVASQARMYVSHFMQVLVMAFQRGEIKRTCLEYYGFDDIPEVLPRLVNYDELVEVGKRLIDGERKRVMQGGIAINCPTIQVVNVFYEKFREVLFSHRTTIQSTERNQQNVKNMRDQIDELLLNVWDEVEAFYAELPPYARLLACQNCGIIYYYHKGEKPLTPESDVSQLSAPEEVKSNAETSQASADYVVDAPSTPEPEPQDKDEDDGEIIIIDDDAIDQSLF